MTPVRIAVAPLLAGLAAVLMMHVASADPQTIGMRTGDHPGYGRIAFDLVPGIGATATTDGNRVLVHFDADANVRTGAAIPRNVRGVTATPGQVEVSVVPGGQVRTMLTDDNKFVVDVWDPPSASSPPPPPVKSPSPVPPAAPAAAASAKPAPPKVAAVAPGGATPPLDRRDDGPATLAAAAAAPAAPPALASPPADAQALAAPPADAPPTEAAAHDSQPEKAVAPPDWSLETIPAATDPAPTLMVGTVVTTAVMSIAATPVRPPAGLVGRAVALPFDPGVGAAAFRRGPGAIVVFDEQRPIDLAALRTDPAFAAATIQLLPGATILQLPLRVRDELRLLHTDPGWVVVVVEHPSGAATVLRAIRPQPAAGLVRLPADHPGQVVAMTDPETGGTLLVGTQVRPGQAVAVARTAPEYALLPTWQGVAVEPVSDRLALRLAPSGFVLNLGPLGGVGLADAEDDALPAADPRPFSRRFDFPALGQEALLRRLQSATDAAAAMPVRDRAAARLRVAQAMLALGMGAEAQSVLGLAAADDGRVADSGDLKGLAAIAAMLAGRPGEADGIADSRLSGTDEVALWRAVLAAMRDEGSPAAAPVFAAELPLLLSYPPGLRDRLLPLAAETMALGGERVAAKRLLDSRADDHALDLARGLLLQEAAIEPGGNPALALAVYDRLSHGRDRLVRARAAVRAVEMRLAAGLMQPARAAEALDQLIYAWRGDDREFELRKRVAVLWQQAGEWRRALAALREAEDIWPEQRLTLHARMVDIFAAAIAHDATKPLPPLDLVALVEENADLLPAGEAGQALGDRLADRLATLDLPQRAVPVLEKLVASVPSGTARAAFGERLASMRLEAGNAAGALSALADSEATPLPDKLREARTMTFARAAAANGELPRATAALAALGTATADGLRADLVEAAKDWPAAEAALRDYAAKTVPDTGLLDEAQARTLLRLASAAAQSGDDATVSRLRERDTRRLPKGKLAEMFRLITSGPVQGVADLPRAVQETKLAGTLPAALKAIGPETQPVSLTP